MDDKPLVIGIIGSMRPQATLDLMGKTRARIFEQYGYDSKLI